MEGIFTLVSLIIFFVQTLGNNFGYDLIKTKSLAIFRQHTKMGHVSKTTPLLSGCWRHANTDHYVPAKLMGVTADQSRKLNWL